MPNRPEPEPEPDPDEDPDEDQLAADLVRLTTVDLQQALRQADAARGALAAAHPDDGEQALDARLLAQASAVVGYVSASLRARRMPDNLLKHICGAGAGQGRELAECAVAICEANERAAAGAKPH